MCQTQESIFKGIPLDKGGIALKQSLSVFLLKYVEKSPKNVSKSQFRKNYKTALKLCKSDGLSSVDDIV